MLPGFINLFKDKESFVHLYFYKGLLDNNIFYYKDLDLSQIKSKYSYKIINYDDGSKEYIFDNTKIKSITCKLVNYQGKEEIKKIKINDGKL